MASGGEFRKLISQCETYEVRVLDYGLNAGV
jgi:hypothetical protein